MPDVQHTPAAGDVLLGRQQFPDRYKAQAMEANPHAHMALAVCPVITISKEQVLLTFHFLNRRLW